MDVTAEELPQLQLACSPQLANERISYSHPVIPPLFPSPPFSNLLPSPDEGDKWETASQRLSGWKDGRLDALL